LSVCVFIAGTLCIIIIIIIIIIDWIDHAIVLVNVRNDALRKKLNKQHRWQN
jgi:hypothetical protein